MRVLGEGGLGQQVDPLPVHRRDLEVEAGQVSVHRGFGRMHLVAERAPGPVVGLGGQQVLDQPACAVQLRAGTLPGQVGPGAGHAVKAQLREFDDHVRHGGPPRWGRCEGQRGRRSRRCRHRCLASAGRRSARCAVTQRPGLPLQQRDAVLPGIAGLAAAGQPLVTGHGRLTGFRRNRAVSPSIAANTSPIRKPVSRTGSLLTRIGL